MRLWKNSTHRRPSNTTARSVQGGRESGNYFLRDDSAFYFSCVRLRSNGPHSRLETFNRERIAFEQLVSHIEAAIAPFRDSGLNDHIVSESRGGQKASASIDHRDADDPVGFQHFLFGQSCCFK